MKSEQKKELVFNYPFSPELIFQTSLLFQQAKGLRLILGRYLGLLHDAAIFQYLKQSPGMELSTSQIP